MLLRELSEIYLREEQTDSRARAGLPSFSSSAGWETGRLKLRRLWGVKEPIVVLLAGERDLRVGGGQKPPDGMKTRVVLLRSSLLF